MELAGSCPSDGNFGPAVSGCRGDFDFTILFENVVLSIIPSSVTIALSLARLWSLHNATVVASGLWRRNTQLVLLTVVSMIQLSALGLAATSVTLRASLVASAALEFVCTLVLAVMLFFQHTRDPSPSHIINIYLPIDLLLSIARIRTVYMAASSLSDTAFASLACAAVVVKFVVMILEAQDKRNCLVGVNHGLESEASASIYSRAVFFWLRHLLIAGSSHELQAEDMYPLPKALTANQMAKKIDSLEYSQMAKHKNSLLLQVLWRTAPTMSLGYFWLLPMIGLSICQPLIINAVVNYLDDPDGRSKSDAYGLIGATVIAYLGSPLLGGLCWSYVVKGQTEVRILYAIAIYKKTVSLSSAAADSAKAMTLMNTDVERILVAFRTSLWLVHAPIQTIVSFYLIHRQIGNGVYASVVIILVSAIACSVLAIYCGRSQGAWMTQIERRVAKTTSIASNMKNIKISGLSHVVQTGILGLRKEEMRLANKYRFLDSIVEFFSVVPAQLAALFTFIFSSSLDTASMFTTIGLLALLAMPVLSFVQALPAIATMIRCSQRIQEFLVTEPHKDFRELIASECHGSRLNTETAVSPSVEMKESSFGWTKDKMVLQGINCTLGPGLNIIVGPVASGKSTFCKALLGETPAFSGRTIFNVDATKVAYCDQTPFLSNGTIRENIIGFGNIDEDRYQQALTAAMLHADLQVLPKHDETKIGSNGITLSGGQRQRVSIARAVYNRCVLYIFDDILSGLDTDTEQAVFDRVFGPTGLLKQQNAIVVLCTHSIRHLPSADHIIALGSGGDIVEQGNFLALSKNGLYIQSLDVTHGNTSPNDSGETVSAEANSEMSKKQQLEEERPNSKTFKKLENGWAPMLDYMRSAGMRRFVPFMALSCLCGFGWNFQNIIVKWWTADMDSEHQTHSVSFWKGIYALFSVGNVILSWAQTFVGANVVAAAAGISLHRKALDTLISAPLSLITKTDLGALVNHFAQDISMVDNELSISIISFVLQAAYFIGACAIPITTSPYMVIAYPFIGAAAVYLLRSYLPTSRGLRMFDLERRSPLFTSFMDTMQGIITYRAYGWIDASVQRNNALLDAAIQPSYLYRAVLRWLFVCLEFLNGIIGVLVVVLATQLQANRGFAGASLVAVITLTVYLTSALAWYGNLELSLSAIIRLKRFTEDTILEDLPGEDIVPPVSWPETGTVSIKDVSASYEQEVSREGKLVGTPKNFALRNLSLEITNREKIAICGRTGSGKSSFILLLLRILDSIMEDSGSQLTIDGLALDSIDRQTLRERMIALPQDPVFLPDGGTVRENVDVHNTATDDECRDALVSVNLCDRLAENGGLSSSLNADSMSQGQKQLFSLARAIVRRRVRLRLLTSDIGDGYGVDAHTASKEKQAMIAETRPAAAEGGLLILDEYSSSLDVETDRLMQHIIKREFANYTIIMVSHRLELVLDFFDRVVILDNGRVLEDGNPKTLAATDGTRFRELCAIARKSEPETEPEQPAP